MTTREILEKMEGRTITKILDKSLEDRGVMEIHFHDGFKIQIIPDTMYSGLDLEVIDDKN